jgi:hypothetical protein
LILIGATGEFFMNKFLIIAAIVGLSISTAQASDLCKPVDQSKWMKKEVITEKLVAMGYEVRQVQAEDGCWELKGKKDGKRVEAYFDPITAALVLTK